MFLKDFKKGDFKVDHTTQPVISTISEWFAPFPKGLMANQKLTGWNPGANEANGNTPTDLAEPEFHPQYQWCSLKNSAPSGWRLLSITSMKMLDKDWLVARNPDRPFWLCNMLTQATIFSCGFLIKNGPTSEVLSVHTLCRLQIELRVLSTDINQVTFTEVLKHGFRDIDLASRVFVKHLGNLWPIMIENSVKLTGMWELKGGNLMKAFIGFF